MRKTMTILCGVLALAAGCSNAKYDSSTPTLRNYGGTASNRDNYVGWDVKYALDNPSTYQFSDQRQLTEPKNRQIATDKTQSAISTADAFYDDSDDD